MTGRVSIVSFASILRVLVDDFPAALSADLPTICLNEHCRVDSMIA